MLAHRNMSPAADTGSPGPFIAGAEDPVATSELQDSPDDPFGSERLYDFSTSSPDTLQRLDAKRKADTQKLFSDTHLELSTSPNGSYHEYSDDSAESLKLSSNRDTQTPNETSPSDIAMNSVFESSLTYEDIFDADAPFSVMDEENEPSQPQPNGLFDDDGFMDPASTFDQQFMPPQPPSSAMAIASPEMPTITPSDNLAPGPSHHRQNSVRHHTLPLQQWALANSSKTASIDGLIEWMARRIAGGFSHDQPSAEPGVDTGHVPNPITTISRQHIY